MHLGHQAVLQEIGRRAQAARRASVLVTFDPHPLEVVNPGAAPPLLTTGPERLEILALSPLDYVLLVRFDRHLAGLTPEQFVREVLLARCAVRELVIGHDHGFGRGRSGDVETLRRLGASRTASRWTWSRRWISAVSTSPAAGSAARLPVAISRPRGPCWAGRTEWSAE